MNIFFIYLLAACSGTCCLYCSSPSTDGCLTCDAGYYLYNSLTCLKVCPSGYDLVGQQCIKSNDVMLTDLKLFEHSDFNARTVQGFYNNFEVRFSDSQGSTFIPTKDRGFYSTSNSILISSTNWVPGPDLTIMYWVYATSPGTVLQVIDSSSTSLQVLLTTNYTLSLKSRSQTDASTQTQSFLSKTVTLNAWQYGKITYTQSTADTIQVQLYLDTVVANINTLTGQEFQPDLTNYWFLGSLSGGSFIGFLYEFRIDNQLIEFDLDSYTISSCAYSYYVKSDQTCGTCQGSCDWHACTQSTCSVCSECSYCKGYNNIDCSCGGDRCCQRGCLNCPDYYTCDTCQDGYTLLDGVCLAQAPYINQNFTGDFVGSYGKFITGDDETKFYYKSSPETTDPIPIRYRGLYFNGLAYMKYSDSLLMNSNFAIAMWVKYQSGGVLVKGNYLNYEYNQLGILLSFVPDGGAFSYSSSSIPVCSYWTHLAFGVSSTDGIQITVYLDNEQVNQYSDVGLAFIDDIASTLYLGKSLNAYFTGFLYTFKLWQVHISDFAYEFLDEICGKSLSSGCLSECPLTYYDSNSCKPCSSSCAWGCVDTRTTCTICSSYLCQYCDSFDTTDCIQCISNASGTPCKCNDGFYDLNYICNACYDRCATCSNGGYGCLTCTSSYFKCENVCVGVCPSGYTQSSSACSKVSSTVLDLDLRSTFEIGNLSNYIIGSDSTNAYPNFDANDPWPAVSRGFYFTSGKFLLGQLRFSPTFSLAMWVRALNPGTILKKTGMISLSASTTTSYTLNVALMNGNLISKPVTVSANWNFISFSVSIITSYTITQVSAYLNRALLGTSTNNGFISDEDDTQDLIIGYPAGGFTGFIATFSVYADNTLATSTFTLACATCSCSYCLSTCTIYQDPDKGCASCPSECNFGCRNGLCNLCLDSICQSCGDRGTSGCNKCNDFASGSPCECDLYYFSCLGNCYPCFSRCETCDSFGIWCVSCKDGMKLLNYFCVDECPTGASEDGGVCVLNEVSLANLEFRDVVSLGSIDGFVVGSVDNNTYPDYDPNDPYPTYNRGYYFHDLAFITKNCVLSPNLTLTMWALITQPGPLLNKTSPSSSLLISSTSSSLHFNISLLDSEVFLDSPYNSSNWVLFSLTTYIFSNSTSISLYISSSLLKTTTVSLYLTDSNSTLFLPSTENSGFLGFIWFVSINQYSNQALSSYSPMPNSTCQVNTYNENCTVCPEECTRSCADNSCNICPDKLCATCSSFSGPCDVCKGNSSLAEGVCDCDLGFYADLEECHPCYSYCRDCTYKYISNCSKCFDGYYFLNDGICGKCGLGFNISGEDHCEEHNALIFKLDLNNTMKNVVVESVNDFEVVTGLNSKFYPDYDKSDPYVAYLRGYYFNGIGSFMSVNNSKFVIPHKFEVDFWLNPTEGTGTIFSKGNFSVYIQDFYLTASIVLTNSQLQLYPSEPLRNSSWNHIILTYTFDTEYTTVTLNSNSNTSFGYFIDDSTYALFGKNAEMYLTGFLYTFSIYSGQRTSRFLQACLEPCGECLDSGYCIPTCLITEYWVGPNFDDCKGCKAECGTGCRSSKTCSLCADEKCKSCDSLEPESSCQSCFLNSNENGSCECDSGYFWNPILLFCYTCESYQYPGNNICNNCTDLCLTCTDSLNCLTCIENASVQYTMCYCEIGYRKNENSCDRHVLKLELVVDSDNKGSLQFNETLKYDLDSTDIGVKVNGSWTLEKYSDRFYKINVEFSGAVKKGEKIEVTLINLDKFVSVTNATPDTYYFEQELNEVPDAVDSVLEAAKQLAQTVTTAVTSAVTAASLLNPNPACLWSFINTIQMVVFIILASVPIPSNSKGLIIGLKNYNMFPNIFEYFVPSGDTQSNQNAYDLGYHSDSLLLNIGRAITAFISFMLLWLILGLLNILITKGICQKKFFVDNVKEFLADYKYGFFIRYGITNYIEFEIAALIGILNYNHTGLYSILNTVFCSITLLLLAATPVLCFLMVMKRKKKNQSEKNEFDTMYGTLFYEFNNDKGLMTSNFYVFFFLKRGIYGIILIFLRDFGVIQMTLILILCFSYLLYLLYFKPFGEKLLNISNIISEIATLIIFSMITWLLFDLSKSSKEKLDNVIYYLVYTLMGIQMAASIIMMVKSIRDKIAAKKANKTTAVVPMSQEDNDPEVKNLNIMSNSNDVSRVDYVDEARSRKTASNFSKYGKFFE